MLIVSVILVCTTVYFYFIYSLINSVAFSDATISRETKIVNTILC